MNLEKLFEWVIVIVIGFAMAGKLDTLTHWVNRAQARLVYESRASAWGSPSIFVRDYRDKYKPNLIRAQKLNTANSKTEAP